MTTLELVLVLATPAMCVGSRICLRLRDGRDAGTGKAGGQGIYPQFSGDRRGHSERTARLRPGLARFCDSPLDSCGHGIPATGVSRRCNHRRIRLAYIFGVQLPTFRVNVPLNNALQALEVDAMDDDSMTSARINFEARWVAGT
jgi:hypothetical protein